ncbi:MAG: rhodanese-like domain-containing protein [Eubacterium sp.]|nr:rhodanese-like domain-containing protein [Eubacterium sp.]MCM1213118.1 rhodanese-like domain-containing protein [Lachnospiraceae bacterium]MCM1239423.1 rhodanese-like domain-containing protein [Lachnospiraceae bacterium]
MSENTRKTPIMGWASWNCFRTDISEQRMKEQADALVNTGLAECGYTYLNMDDGFFGGRDEKGILQFHKERFPNGIKPVADYAHSLGLKAGTYAEGGDKTCGFYYDREGQNGDNVGLYEYEEQDLAMYLEECGFDFIKVDWCGGLRLGLDEQEQYTKIGKIIDEIRDRTGKCIVYNICRWQFPGAWAADIADSWRTGADISPDFKSVLHQIDNIKPLARYCRPGHVNDLDMMQIGNGMSAVDERTHFAMWCMMSTPLMIGCDLTKIDGTTLEILKNRELIAIDQDTACIQAYVVKEFRSRTGELLGEIWVKDLGTAHSNRKAVAFLNRSEQPLWMDFTFSELGLQGEIRSIRDLQAHENINMPADLCVAPHETKVFQIESEYSAAAADIHTGSGETPQTAETISPETARSLMDQGASLVDVRSAEEYRIGHPENAINLPYTEIHVTAEQTFPDKAVDIILYCSTGKRSRQAAATLNYLGFEHVYCLKRNEP